MQSAPSSDASIVAAMAAGDPGGLEAAYRRYADRLFGYARSIVGDPDAAADVVQETFLIASQRVHQVREPDRFGPWLYTIARNEARRWLRTQKRVLMLDADHEPVVDTDPGRALHASQVRELVRAASGGLSDADKEVFELTVRHGMSIADVAGVLGVSVNHAHARMSRARTQFEGALGALMLARAGGEQCPDMQELLRGWDGKLTALLRKRIERHAKSCAICGAQRRERMQPAELLAAYSALPFLAMAHHARASATRLASSSTEPATRPMARSDSPLAEPARGSSRRAMTVAAIAIVALLAIGVGAGLSQNLLTAEPSGTPSPVAVSAAPGQSLIAPSATSAPPTTPPPTTAPPRPSTSTVVVVPFTATATVSVQSCSGSVKVWNFEATVSGGTLKSARLYYESTSAAMSIAGGKASHTVHDTASQMTWWVVATATDGRTDETPHRTSMC